MESEIYCGMESDRSAEWNHGNAVYGIKLQELYSIRASRNGIARLHRNSIQRVGRVDSMPSLRLG
jgi:hypothetical protein